jgi:hypothetical protein
VPTVPASAHERHVPWHAVAQHTPCSQKPALHSAAAAQAAPIGFLPQLMFAHVLGALQSPDVEHVVRHAPPDPHVYGSQVDGVAARQLPLPLQLRAGVKATPTHVAGAHVAPAAYSRQAPAPSQVPSVPHASTPLSGHCASGSAPAGTSVQVPSVPASAHERQVPVQLELQHTPCWHKPEAHSVPALHVSPSGRFEHWPPLQTLGAAQSALVEHAVRHRPFVPQLYGAHAIAAGVWHTPAPLQVRGGA